MTTTPTPCVWSGVAQAYADSFAGQCAHTVGPLVAALGGRPNLRWLDVGTGAGAVAAEAARHGCLVVGADPEPDMLALARAAAPTATFVQAALPALPFADGAFDRVSANFVLNHVPDPRRCVAELARLLAPGGRLGVTVWPSAPVPIRTLWDEVIAQAGVAGPAALVPPGADFERTPGGVAGLLSDAGLRAVRSWRHDFTHVVAADRWWAGAVGGVARIGRTYLAHDRRGRAAMTAAFEGLSARYRGSEACSTSTAPQWWRPPPANRLRIVLILLSPAKSLDYETKLPTVRATQPRLLPESEQLVDVMRTKSVAELAALAEISDELAALNAQRWAAFHTPFTRRNARPAVLAFNGDVYQGLAVRDRFDARDYTEAQKTLRILSGLYGVLRPLDLIQPYRLEMGSRLATGRGSSLYEWWGSVITDLLRDDLDAAPGAKVVVNLASTEYFGAVRPAELGAPVVSPRFEDTDARGHRRVVSFFAKRARGELASWLVRNRVRTPAALKGFDAAGYRYDEDASTRDVPVFVRSFADRH